ncbi:hypothetical protein ACSSS7_004448 [Eimeria intestinalis]
MTCSATRREDRVRHPKNLVAVVVGYKVYDKFGEEGLKAGGPASGGPGGPNVFYKEVDPSEIFSRFFGTDRMGGDADDPFSHPGGRWTWGSRFLRFGIDALSQLPYSGWRAQGAPLACGSAPPLAGVSFTAAAAAARAAADAAFAAAAPAACDAAAGADAAGGGSMHAGVGASSKPRAYERDLVCSLEELYTGTTKKMKIGRTRGGRKAPSETLGSLCSAAMLRCTSSTSSSNRQHEQQQQQQQQRRQQQQQQQQQQHQEGCVHLRVCWCLLRRITFAGEGGQEAPNGPPGDLVL